MSNPNFVSDLVAMAKAFEELPSVKEALFAQQNANVELVDTIQRLELRIIDLKSELDAAHAATRKAEVERDHAEEMFLSADDRLNAFTRLLASFQSDTAALVKAAEPVVESAPVSEPTVAELVTDPGPAIASHAPEWHGDPTNVDSVSSGPQGSRAEGPIGAGIQETQSTDDAMTASSPAHNSEGVSVPSDPTPAMASSFESGSPGSVQPEMERLHTIATTSQDINERIHANNELETLQEAPHPVDPTASSMAGDGPSHATAAATPSVDTSADASLTATLPDDDVGYHNEPKVENVGSADGWIAWDAWAARMNVRYGVNGWPSRDAQAAQ